MKAANLLLTTLLLHLSIGTLHAGPEVDRLLAQYGKIETVTCQIRRTKEGEIGKMKFLSRVYWTRQGQLHAEGITPLKRRTIADGERLWQYVEGDPKGFSRPIDALSEKMSISLRLVPGTAMDHLLRLKGYEERLLSGNGTAPAQIGIQSENRYVVLVLDKQRRLSGIEFYEGHEQKVLQAQYAYSDFSEVLPGTWVPFTHEITVSDERMAFRETAKIDRFIANQPIAASLFIPESFFDKDIDFVDDFAKIFPSEK